MGSKDDEERRDPGRDWHAGGGPRRTKCGHESTIAEWMRHTREAYQTQNTFLSRSFRSRISKLTVENVAVKELGLILIENGFRFGWSDVLTCFWHRKQRLPPPPRTQVVSISFDSSLYQLPSVPDINLSPSRESLGDAPPGGAMDLELSKKQCFFLDRPWVIDSRRREVILPSVAALPSTPVRDSLGNGTPVPSSKFLDSLSKEVVLVEGEFVLWVWPIPPHSQIVFEKRFPRILSQATLRLLKFRYLSFDIENYKPYLADLLSI
jgi:hypothetical protein